MLKALSNLVTLTLGYVPMKKLQKHTDCSTVTLTAANDNCGGVTSVEVAMASFVTIIAKAYVARLSEEQQQ
jgi:hypothetical protein